jgi:hypothetical protein
VASSAEVFTIASGGRGSGTAQKDIERRFSNITTRYKDLRQTFLTAVDYVSHSLRGRTVAVEFNSPLQLTMPSFFGSVVMPPNKLIPLDPARLLSHPKPDLEPRPGALLTLKALINMTAKQLVQIKNSDEYGSLKEMFRLGPEVESERLQRAIGDYLRIIERQLMRLQSTKDDWLRFVGKVLKTDNGVLISILVDHFSDAHLRPFVQRLLAGTEIWFSDRILPRVRPITLTGRPPNWIRLSDDVKLYLPIIGDRNQSNRLD